MTTPIDVVVATDEAVAAHKAAQEEFDAVLANMLEDPSGVSVAAYQAASNKLRKAFFAVYPNP